MTSTMVAPSLRPIDGMGWIQGAKKRNFTHLAHGRKPNKCLRLALSRHHIVLIHVRFRVRRTLREHAPMSGFDP